MKPVLSVHGKFREIPVATPPQILNCAHCVLLEWEHDDLSAPYWRWYCNDRPGAWLLLPSERIFLEPGQIFLIPPHTIFGTGLGETIGHLYVHFTLGLDRAVTPGQIFKHRPTPAERAWIKRLVQTDGSPAENRALESSFLAQALVNAALAAVPPDYWDGRLTDARITHALRSLGQKENAESNAELARAAGMNPNAFIRKFAQATGHSPHQYRLRLRIERASAWLREGRMNIDQIATDAGFCDRFHFSRVFKQVMGISPARYRRASGALSGNR